MSGDMVSPRVVLTMVTHKHRVGKSVPINAITTKVQCTVRPVEE